MDSLTSYLSDYWWVVALPVMLMMFVWAVWGRGLRWVFLLCVAGLVFFYFSDGKSSGVGSALNQVVNQVVDVLRRVGSSLF